MNLDGFSMHVHGYITAGMQTVDSNCSGVQFPFQPAFPHYRRVSVPSLFTPDELGE